MKTSPVIALIACLGFTGCYTQLYTGGYAARTLDDRDYANTTDTQADTGLASDSSGTAGRGGDTLYRPGSVVVNKVAGLPAGHGFNAATLEYGDLVADGIVDPVTPTVAFADLRASLAPLTRPVAGERQPGMPTPTVEPSSGVKVMVNLPADGATKSVALY